MRAFIKAIGALAVIGAAANGYWGLVRYRPSPTRFDWWSGAFTWFGIAIWAAALLRRQKESS